MDESSNKGKSSGGLFGGITDTLIDGLKTVFKNLAPMLAGALVLLFPEATIDIVEGLMTGLKHLGIVVLKTVHAIASGLSKLNDMGISPGELALGGAALAGGAIAGNIAGRVGRGAGKAIDWGKSLFGEGPDAKKRGGLVGAGTRNSRAKTKKPLSLLDRLKAFFASPAGRAAEQKLITKEGKKIAGTAVLNALPGAGSIIWSIISLGISAYTAYELYEMFTEWDDNQEDGGQTTEEMSEEKKALKKGITEEEKEAAERAETKKSLDAKIGRAHV